MTGRVQSERAFQLFVNQETRELRSPSVLTRVSLGVPWYGGSSLMRLGMFRQSNPVLSALGYTRPSGSDRKEFFRQALTFSDRRSNRLVQRSTCA